MISVAARWRGVFILFLLFFKEFPLMYRPPYSTDLTDEQWAVLAPLIPGPLYSSGLGFVKGFRCHLEIIFIHNISGTLSYNHINLKAVGFKDPCEIVHPTNVLF